MSDLPSQRDGSSRMRTTIAAIVPATDEPPTLDRCTAALRAGARAPDELIVQCRPVGTGPAAARNAGAARASADVLVFVDSDVEVHPDALARIGRRFAREPDLDAVFGAYDDNPSAPGLTSRFRNLLHHHVHVSSAGPAETFWAGLGAIRRGAFEAVGGFDADRFRTASIEDIELGMRLHEHGARLMLDPRIRGRHLKAWTPLSMARTDFARRGVPWARLLLRQRRSADTLNLGWGHRASALASVLLALSVAVRRPRLAFASMLGVLVLNRELYGLLARKGGASLIVAGIGLHLLHQLVAVASLPAALVLHVMDSMGELARPSSPRADRAPCASPGEPLRSGGHGPEGPDG